MGMWDVQPWDNDTAADWFGDLMEATRLREQWLEGIEAVDDPDVTRAAAWIFIQLGRVYVWPITTLDEDLERTIEALQAVREDEGYAEVPELVAAIDAEIAELVSRRK